MGLLHAPRSTLGDEAAAAPRLLASYSYLYFMVIFPSRFLQSTLIVALVYWRVKTDEFVAVSAQVPNGVPLRSACIRTLTSETRVLSYDPHE